MSWTYANPSASPKDEVRFLVGDTDVEKPILSDEELVYCLGLTGGSAIGAAIRACESIMAKFSRMSDETVGSVSISFSQRAAAYEKMGARLQKRQAMCGVRLYAGGISRLDKRRQELSADRVSPEFTRHMLFGNRSREEYLAMAAGTMGEVQPALSGAGSGPLSGPSL